MAKKLTRGEELDALAASVLKRLRKCSWGDLDYDEEAGGAFAEAAKRNRRGAALDWYTLHWRSQRQALRDLVGRAEKMEAE